MRRFWRAPDTTDERRQSSQMCQGRAKIVVARARTILRATCVRGAPKLPVAECMSVRNGVRSGPFDPKIPCMMCQGRSGAPLTQSHACQGRSITPDRGAPLKGNTCAMSSQAGSEFKFQRTDLIRTRLISVLMGAKMQRLAAVRYDTKRSCIKVLTPNFKI